jgi:hypothetical protein
MNARRLLASASAVGALLALSACEKPVPIVTVVSGGESVYTEASTWCFEDQQPPDCVERESGVQEVSVRGGETVGVDVDAELVERGWYIELSEPEGQAAEGQQPSQPQRSEPQDGHYFTFTAPNLPAGSELLLNVRALGEGEEPSGAFAFRLTPER